MRTDVVPSEKDLQEFTDYKIKDYLNGEISVQVEIEDNSSFKSAGYRDGKIIWERSYLERKNVDYPSQLSLNLRDLHDITLRMLAKAYADKKNVSEQEARIRMRGYDF